MADTRSHSMAREGLLRFAGAWATTAQREGMNMLSRVMGAATLALMMSGPGFAATAGAGKGGFAVARWAGVEVQADELVPGLGDEARESIERWRTFAEKRGYRIDLDASQRVLVVSDRSRFRTMSQSLAIIERTLDATEELTGPRETPVMLLRASSEEDASTARRASDALGFGGLVFTHVETGSLRERRAVDARLSESVVRAELAVHAPHLSQWMIDGLASSIAEDVTSRAIVDGKAVSLKTIQSRVSKAARDRDRQRVSLLEVSGVAPGEAVAPREDEAMAIMAYLTEYQAAALPQIIAQLGSSEPNRGVGRYVAEEAALREHCGLNALEEIELALRKGRSYRGR